MRRLLLLFLSVSLHSEIVEIKTLSEILSYVSRDTLIIFDIDNTLIQPAQDLGSTQWLYHRQSQLCQEGVSVTIALKSAIAEWAAIQQVTEVLPVEPTTSNVIHALQKNGYSVMALTTRGFETLRCTLDQLRRVKIDMSASPPFDHELFFSNGENAIYTRGILFTNGTDHGTALQKFFQQSEIKPKQIAFVNDKGVQLRLVERACSEDKISFIGLRYGYLDEKVKNFTPEIAEIQRTHFGQILSNAHVKKLISKEE